MKKKMLYLMACVFLVLVTVSCGRAEPRSAKELYDRIDKEMDALESYRTDMSMSMTFFVSGNEVKGEATSYTVENSSDGSYYFCQEATTNVTCEALSLNESVTNFEAYYDGNYFISSGSGYKTTQKLYSPMTAKEAKEYRFESDSDLDEFMEDCTTKTFSKREDGTWELNYSGYTKVAIEKIGEEMGLDDGTFPSADVMDMNVTVVADANYRVAQIKIEFVFKESSNVPSFSCTADYSQYNEAVAELDYLNVKKYTKVDDIRVLRDIEDMLDERSESESGEFTLDIQQFVKDRNGKHLSSYTEKDDVSFGEGADGYFYDIVLDVNRDRYNVSYKNGTQTVTGYGSQDKRQSEQEARDFIESLINASGYSSGIVTGMEFKGDGVYELICGNAEEDTYRSYYQQNGGKMTSVEQIMTVTIKDGQIVSILNSVEAEGTIPSYGTVFMTLTQTITFGDQAPYVLENANDFR